MDYGHPLQFGVNITPLNDDPLAHVALATDGLFAGIYLSFETDQDPARLHDAFPPAHLERLRKLKRQYDPTNVFRDNFNLLPDEVRG